MPEAARVTPRTALRPAPDQWGADEPMTLAEFIAVFHPHGPLTVSALRGEIRDGRLLTARVRGKLYVTPANVAALFEPRRQCPADRKDPASISDPPGRKSGRSPSGLSETDRKRLALLVAQNALQKLSGPSPTTSRPSGRRRQAAAPTAQVIPLTSSSPTS